MTQAASSVESSCEPPSLEIPRPVPPSNVKVCLAVMQLKVRKIMLQSTSGMDQAAARHEERACHHALTVFSDLA